MSTVVEAIAPPPTAWTVAAPVYANRFRKRLPLRPLAESHARDAVIQEQAGVEVVGEVDEEAVAAFADDVELRLLRRAFRTARRPSAACARAGPCALARSPAPSGSQRALRHDGHAPTPARCSTAPRIPARRPSARRCRRRRWRTRTQACRRRRHGSRRRRCDAPSRRASSSSCAAGSRTSTSPGVRGPPRAVRRAPGRDRALSPTRRR